MPRGHIPGQHWELFLHPLLRRQVWRGRSCGNLCRQLQRLQLWDLQHFRRFRLPALWPRHHLCFGVLRDLRKLPPWHLFPIASLILHPLCGGVFLKLQWDSLLPLPRWESSAFRWQRLLPTGLHRLALQL